MLTAVRGWKRLSIQEPLRHAAAHRGGMARQPQHFAGVDYPVSLHPVDLQVAGCEIADVEIRDVEVLPIWAERYALGLPTRVDRTHLAYGAACSREHVDDGIRVCEPSILRQGTAAAVQRQCDGEVPGRIDRKTLREVVDAQVVDHVRRSCLQVDDGHRAGAAVGYTAVPWVRGEAEAAIRGNLHVEGKHAYPEIDLAVGHLLPVNVKPGDLVDRTFRGQCMLPVWGDGHSRDAVAHGHRVDEFDLLAVDREYADRIVGAIGDQDEVARPVDREARGLLADLDGGNHLGGLRMQIDHE